MTTFTSYGQVPQYRQAEILNELAEPRDRSAAMNIDDLSNDQVRELLNGLASRFGPASGSSSPTS